MITKPSLIAYTVKSRGEGQRAIWTKIGAAWPHTNGSNGVTLILEAVSLDGRIVLMPNDANTPATHAAER